MINYFQPLSHEKRMEEENLKFVISDSYGLYFQPPRRLKHFLYYVSEPFVGASKKKKKNLLDGLREILKVIRCYSTIWKVLEDSKD